MSTKTLLAAILIVLILIMGYQIAKDRAAVKAAHDAEVRAEMEGIKRFWDDRDARLREIQNNINENNETFRKLNEDRQNREEAARKRELKNKQLDEEFYGGKRQ